MDDGLIIMNKKLGKAIRAFIPPTGVLDFWHFGEVLTDHLAKSANLTDNDATLQCLYGIERVLISKLVKQGRDISWTTLDEYIESLRWFQLKDPRRWMKNMEYKMATIFNIIDQDGDGFVNQEEFNIYYQLGYRKDDTEFLTRAFRAMDTEKLGKVTRKQYVDAYVNYFSDPDIGYVKLPLY